jgi:hypothetical protein
MARLIALVLLPVLAAMSPHQESKSVGQANKAETTTNNAKQKKKMPPAATPEPAESKINKPSFQYNQTYPCDSVKPVHNWVDTLNATSTAVVGAFTVVLAVIGARQFLASKMTERAWIVCLPPDPPTRNPNTGDAEIRWELENRGHTPAWVTILGSAGKIVRAGDEIPENPPYTMAGPFPREGTVLAPNGKVLRGLTIPAAHMAFVEQGTHVLFIFGIVEYRDVFKGKHETRYCYRFKPGPTDADPSPRDFYVDGPRAYIRAT